MHLPISNQHHSQKLQHFHIDLGEGSITGLYISHLDEGGGFARDVPLLPLHLLEEGSSTQRIHATATLLPSAALLRSALQSVTVSTKSSAASLM